MQSNAKKMSEQRTLKEIYSSLSQEGKIELTQRVLKFALVSDSAWRNWRNGYRTPRLIHQRIICKALKQMQINVTPEILFRHK